VTEDIDTRIEIELLKKDVTTMSALLTKFDMALDKMQEIASSLSRMVSLQEQRLEGQEAATKELQSVLEMRRIEQNSEVKELHSRITTVNKELSTKIEETEKKILDEIHLLRTELIDEDKKQIADNKGIGSRLSSIEMWKYGVVMIVLFLMFLISNNLITIKQLAGG
jgi:hypothetical protein